MSAELLVVIVAATLGSAPAAPPDVLLALPHEAPMSVSLTVSGAAANRDLESYLRERLAQAFASPEDALRSFEIRLDWQDASTLDAWVLEGEEAWARRRFEVTDLVGAKLSLWLFVRSTLKRAAVEPSPSLVPMQIDHEDDGLDVPLTIDAPSARVEDAPIKPLSRPSLRYSVLATGSLVASRLWSAGAAVGASFHAARGMMFGGELGYAVSPGLRDLVVHQLPVSLQLALELPRAEGLAVGVSTTGEAKLAQTETRTRAALGFSLGPFVQLFTGPGATWSLTARFGLAFRAVRQRYLYDAGVARESPWAIAMAFGVVVP